MYAKRFYCIAVAAALVFFASGCSDGTQGGTSAKEYYDRAFSFAHAGNIEEAINLYTLAIEKDPEFIDAYYNRGVMHFFHREYRRAIEDLDRVIEKRPDHSMAYASRGSVYDRIGDGQKALSDYRKAAQLGDEDVQEHLRSKGISWQ
ncbi:MAG TPA: tetratricopeptide repeat protein [Syntrophorhabdaceae bacterium]|nr:tetratricopeptide repeat protein [Syntrophorhabdaceae bacterium]HQM81573.1 tetratricopeptide repeat protein [Syntrophorhabdaceae bacterium]